MKREEVPSFVIPLKASLDSLATSRVVLFGGKGGVGKTTMAALAALTLSKSRRVILFTTDPASNLGDLFSAGGDSVPGNLTTEELHADTLYAQFLDRNLSAFLELGDRGTYLDREELRRFFELALPGVDELMAWLRIGELAEANENSIIVVDTAPTGHTLRMLGGGLHFEQLARALDTMQEKHRSIVRQLTRRDARDAMDEFLTRFEGDASRRRELIAAGAFVPVTLSEPWVVEQTKRLIADVGIDVPFVILNRTAADCDCARCRASAARDAEARREFASVVEAPRSCVPLDSVERLLDYVG
jgi:arsenite-transporting ATPase